MKAFTGFPSGKVRLIPIPGPFFTELLPEIDHLGELQVTLFTFWWMDHAEGRYRYLRRADYLADPRLQQALGDTPEAAESALDEALARAVARGTLLRVELPQLEGDQIVFFLNSPRGRAGARAIEAGQWQPAEDPQGPIEIHATGPNIYRLYEEHIGPLTPMIAETLRDAEDTYPHPWIQEAIRIAVENNVRRWRYVEAILRTWQEEGRDERRPTGNAEEDRHRYVRGRFSEFIEH